MTRRTLATMAASIVAIATNTVTHRASADPTPDAPAPAATPTPAPAPAPAPDVKSLLTGAGTDVEISSDKPDVSVFLAKGNVSDTVIAFPDPFTKIGRAPITTKLVPGVYTMTVEGPNVPPATTVVTVGEQPTHVRIRAGNDGLRDLSTLFLALGSSAVLAATVVELSYSPAPSGISKSKIAVPLFLGGAAALASGISFWFVARTSFDNDGQRSGERAGLSLVTLW